MKINRLTEHKHELVFEGGSMIIDYRELSAIGIMGTSTNFIVLAGFRITDDRFDANLMDSHKKYLKGIEEDKKRVIDELNKNTVVWQVPENRKGHDVQYWMDKHEERHKIFSDEELP